MQWIITHGCVVGIPLFSQLGNGWNQVGFLKFPLLLVCGVKQDITGASGEHPAVLRIFQLQGDTCMQCTGCCGKSCSEVTALLHCNTFLWLPSIKRVMSISSAECVFKVSSLQLPSLLNRVWVVFPRLQEWTFPWKLCEMNLVRTR